LLAVNPPEQSAPAGEVHIEQLEVFARVGVTENERAKSQRLVLSITLWPTDAFETFHDDITRAVNYSAVCSATRDFIRAQSYSLIETFAAELAALLLRMFPVTRVHIELRKFVVPDSEYVAVRVTRAKADA
jgi:dihydroneopterin aldolase